MSVEDIPIIFANIMAVFIMAIVAWGFLEIEMIEGLMNSVRNWHRATGLKIGGFNAEIPTIEEQELRIMLLREEFHEYLDAEAEEDIVDIADALADMMYVIAGTAVAYGIPLDDVVKEVCRSNDSKIPKDGKALKNQDGKIMKGPDYSPPNLDDIVLSI